MLHIAQKILSFLFLRKSSSSWKKSIKKGMKVGIGCEIYKNVDFGSEPYLIEIGNQVRITSGCRFVTHDGGIWVLRNTGDLKDGDIFGLIRIGNNVHIGMNTIIMPNVTIGNNCIIGCGAVVTKSIPDNSIAVGVPARVIRTIDEYYANHKNEVDYTKQLNWEEKKNYLYHKYSL